MKDLYLKFTDEPSMLAALAPLGMTYTDDEGERVSMGTHQFAAWPVGILPGRDGYHLNVRIIDESFDTSALAGYEITPKTPSVVWA